MRVLFATPYNCVSGGVGRWANHIVDYHRMVASDVDLELLPFDDIKKQIAEDYIQKTTVNRIVRGVRVYGRALKELSGRIKTTHYDILHIASSATIGLLRDIVMVHMAHLKGIKVVLHFHFGRIPELAQQRNWEWRLLKYVIERADTTIVIDQMSHDTLVANGLKNVVYIPNPLSNVVNEIISEEEMVERQPRMLMFAGQCVPAKGVYELVDACSMIPDIELRMYGAIKPFVAEELKNRWKSKNSVLQLMGNRPFREIIMEMRRCGVFVLPTYSEGFPNVILESMACRCAIVTTPVGAIPEMLGEENGKHYGIMVEPRNVEQLKDAIEKMLSNEEFKAECEANVQQRVNERYNIDSVWQRMVEAWTSMIG